MRLQRLVATAAVTALALTGCGGEKIGDTGSTGSSAAAANCGTFNLAINPWVGYEATAAVIAYVAEKDLGCTVTKKDLKEEIAWQGFGTGEVDAVVENWGHDDLKKKYIDEQKTAVAAGSTGNKGIIGWYVAPWMAEKYPDITDWNNLNKYASMFKTSESGDKGQLLDGDPSFVTNDEALVKNLKTGLQGGLRRQRDRADHRVPPVRGEEDPGHRVLLRAAVVPGRAQAREGEPSGVHGRLRRRRREDRL